MKTALNQPVGLTIRIFVRMVFKYSSHKIGTKNRGAIFGVRLFLTQIHFQKSKREIEYFRPKSQKINGATKRW